MKTTKTNPTIWPIEIEADDATATGDSLGQLFGLNFTPIRGGGEGWLQTPSFKAGVHGNDLSPGILLFFAIPDREGAIAKVKDSGG